MWKDFICLKCKKPAKEILWNIWIPALGRKQIDSKKLDFFCKRCWKVEKKIGNWVEKCGFCKNYDTDICLTCQAGQKYVELKSFKSSELPNRFGKLLKLMNGEMLGITVIMKNGEFIIPFYDVKRAYEIAVYGKSNSPFD
jgi:hypothetical protein